MSQRIFKNAAILSIAEGINILGGIIIIVAIARLLDKASLGLFSFSFALGSILCIISLYGLTDLIIREISSYPEKANYYFFNSLLVRLFASFILMAILAIALMVKQGSLMDRIIIFSFVWVRIVESIIFMYCGFFRGFHNFLYEMITRSALNVINTLISLFLLFKFRSLVYVAMFQVIFYTLFLCGQYIFVKIRYGLGLFHVPSFSDMLDIIKKGYKFSTISLLIVLLLYLNTIMLTLMKGEVATAIYTASFRFINGLTMLGVGLAAAFYPSMSRYHKEGIKEAAAKIFYSGFKYLLMISVFLAGFLYCFSDKLIVLIYGTKYTASVLLLQIMSVIIVLRFLNMLLTYFMFSVHREGTYLKYLIISLIVSVTLNFILIDNYGYAGAAVASVIPEVLGFIMQFNFARKYAAQITDHALYGRILASLLLSAIVVYILRYQNAALLMLIFSFMYAVAMFACGIINKKDLGILMNADLYKDKSVIYDQY